MNEATAFSVTFFSVFTPVINTGLFLLRVLTIFGYTIVSYHL